MTVDEQWARYVTFMLEVYPKLFLLEYVLAGLLIRLAYLRGKRR